jgi:recombination protein RecA
MFGSPETTPGGRALKFYCSVRLDIRRAAPIKDGDRTIGNRTKVKVVKNKLAPPFRTAEFDIIYGRGISHEGELIDLGVDAGLVDKSGAWLSLADGTRIGQGRTKACEFLVENKEVAAKLDADIREKLLSTDIPAGPPEPEDDGPPEE